MAIVIYTWAILKYDMQILPFNIDRALRALPFVLLGYMLKDVAFKEIEWSKKCVLFSVSLLLYAIAYSAYFFLFTPKGTFKMGVIMQPCLPLFYLSAIGGSGAVMALCLFVNKVRIINWLGQNSLVIMCVHFPLAQWLNTYVSQTSYYTNGGILIKFFISIAILSLCLCFGSSCAFICNKYIPNLTGYKRNFNIQ